MSDETHHKYLSNLRGNQDVFLANIRRSPEFEAIEQKHLKNVFMGIYELLNRVEGDDKNAHKVYACADEISDTFKISKENALRLLLKPQAPAAYSTRYLPHIRREGNEIVLRLHQKTTKKGYQYRLATRKRPPARDWWLRWQAIHEPRTSVLYTPPAHTQGA